MRQLTKYFGSVVVLIVLSGCGSMQNRGAVVGAGDNLNGLGPVHHGVSTKNPEAQRAFDEGLARVYGFNHDAAIKSFKHATELDANLAMAYWGEALALGPNYNVNDVDPAAEKAAFDTVHQAIQHSANATQAERDYIDALSKRYTKDADPDYHQLQVNYAKAMGALSKKYPNDLDAAALWAESMMNLRPWKLWKTDGTPEEGTETIVATLEHVLSVNPNHLGANHYYIHAVEASPHPERALASANRLAALAPKQGHLVHMPAHIYIRTGDYAGAIKANQDAIAVDDKFIACCHPSPGVYPLMYYNHNVHFLMGSACMSNQSKLALSSANKIADDVRPIVPQMAMVEPLCAMPYIVMVRFGKWDEILAQPAPDSSLPTSIAANHFARAMAFAGRHDLPNARVEQAAFESARATSAKVEIGQNTVPQLLEMISHLLNARVQMLNGNSREAIEQLKQAVALQDKLTYDEPPAWPWPVRESLGAALLLNNEPLAAEKVFRDDLRQHPNNPRSLLGLCEALRDQHKSSDAEMSAYRTANKDADVRLDINTF